MRAHTLPTEIVDALRAAAAGERPAVCVSTAMCAQLTDNFSEQRKLGTNPFGGVFEATYHDPLRNRLVRLAISRQPTGSNARAYIEREKRLQVQGVFQHPNLVRLLGYSDATEDQTSGVCCLIHEFVVDGTLSERLDVAPDAQLTWQVLEYALHYLVLNSIGLILYLVLISHLLTGSSFFVAQDRCHCQLFAHARSFSARLSLQSQDQLNLVDFHPAAQTRRPRFGQIHVLQFGRDH